MTTSHGGYKQKRKPYASSGLRSNRSTTSFAVSLMSARVASSVSTMIPCTTGSRVIWESQLRKHVSTYATTAFARAWPSASSYRR
jgi:hypothetical protein